MYAKYVLIAVAVLTPLSRIAGFKLSIAKDLGSTEDLQSLDWSYVEVIEDDDSENAKVTVKVDIPLTLSYSDIFIFFANSTKEILQVTLNKTVQGKFYKMPYNLIRDMESDTTTTTEHENFHQVSGNFPKLWLPKNCSKISASITSPDGRYYNYYGIQNLKLSIPDLMVVEEFKNYE